LIGPWRSPPRRKPSFAFLGGAWADTTAAHRRVILTVLGGLAEFERDLIRTHTGERRGQARGVKLGRKSKLTEDQQREALRRRDGEPVREVPALQCQSQHDFKAHSLRDARKSTRAGRQDRVCLCGAAAYRKMPGIVV
jgi:DNA invertase Pin-like site-specific DNA recombinase